MRINLPPSELPKYEQALISELNRRILIPNFQYLTSRLTNFKIALLIGGGFAQTLLHNHQHPDKKITVTGDIDLYLFAKSDDEDIPATKVNTALSKIFCNITPQHLEKMTNRIQKGRKIYGFTGHFEFVYAGKKEQISVDLNIMQGNKPFFAIDDVYYDSLSIDSQGFMTDSYSLFTEIEQKSIRLANEHVSLDHKQLAFLIKKAAFWKKLNYDISALSRYIIMLDKDKDLLIKTVCFYLFHYNPHYKQSSQAIDQLCKTALYGDKNLFQLFCDEIYGRLDSQVTRAPEQEYKELKTYNDMALRGIISDSEIVFELLYKLLSLYYPDGVQPNIKKHFDSIIQLAQSVIRIDPQNLTQLDQSVWHKTRKSTLQHSVPPQAPISQMKQQKYTRFPIPDIDETESSSDSEPEQTMRTLDSNRRNTTKKKSQPSKQVQPSEIHLSILQQSSVLTQFTEIATEQLGGAYTKLHPGNFLQYFRSKQSRRPNAPRSRNARIRQQNAVAVQQARTHAKEIIAPPPVEFESMVFAYNKLMSLRLKRSLSQEIIYIKSILAGLLGLSLYYWMIKQDILPKGWSFIFTALIAIALPLLTMIGAAYTILREHEKNRQLVITALFTDHKTLQNEDTLKSIVYQHETPPWFEKNIPLANLLSSIPFILASGVMLHVLFDTEEMHSPQQNFWSYESMSNFLLSAGCKSAAVYLLKFVSQWTSIGANYANTDDLVMRPATQRAKL